MSMLLLGCGGSSGAPTDILFITNSGGLALVTTPVPHGCSTGEGVTITGGSASTYDGSWPTITVVSLTTFTLDGSVYSSDVTGGTWAALSFAWSLGFSQRWNSQYAVAPSPMRV